MSDSVTKGVKTSATRPVTPRAAKAPLKGRKTTQKTEARPRPIAKRSASEKAPARKATPAKAAPTTPAKKAKSSPTAGKAGAKARAASPAPVKVTTSAASSANKQAKKGPAKKQAPAAPAKSRPQAKPVSAAKPAPKPAPAPQRQPTRDEAAALRAFERAHKEFVRGNFAAARGLFRGLIEEHSGVAEVTARARTYLAVAEARMRTEAALPRDADALYDRGVIELNRGDYVAAQELFERALKRDDRAADTHYALAAARARLGSIDPALRSLERALELRPNLRIRAQHDADLAALRNEPDFERLVFAPRA